MLRHNGFLQGFGLQSPTPGDDLAARSCACADTHGDQAKGQTAMENCLQKSPDINLVYTINEPAAARRLQRSERPARRRTC